MPSVGFSEDPSMYWLLVDLVRLVDVDDARGAISLVGSVAADDAMTAGVAKATLDVGTLLAPSDHADSLDPSLSDALADWEGEPSGRYAILGVSVTQLVKARLAGDVAVEDQCMKTLVDQIHAERAMSLMMLVGVVLAALVRSPNGSDPSPPEALARLIATRLS